MYVALLRSIEHKRPRAAAKTTKTARGRQQDRARVAGKQATKSVMIRKTGKAASALKKPVKKVGNARKRVEKRLGR